MPTRERGAGVPPEDLRKALAEQYQKEQKALQAEQQKLQSRPPEPQPQKKEPQDQSLPLLKRW